jgi:hypothetical protein
MVQKEGKVIGYFLIKQIKIFKKRAQKLNSDGMSDQAAFYLEKI